MAWHLDMYSATCVSAELSSHEILLRVERPAFVLECGTENVPT